MDGCHVPGGQRDVVVNLVAECETDAQVVQRIASDSTHGRLAANKPGGVERTPKVLREVTGQMRFLFEHRIRAQRGLDIDAPRGV
jgi:hypothetical protein